MIGSVGGQKDYTEFTDGPCSYGQFGVHIVDFIEQLQTFQREGGVAEDDDEVVREGEDLGDGFDSGKLRRGEVDYSYHVDNENSSIKVTEDVEYRISLNLDRQINLRYIVYC